MMVNGRDKVNIMNPIIGTTLPPRKPRLSARALCRRTRPRLTGKEQDAETGLYYYGARYLDPRAGRWLSGDPALGEYVPQAGKGGDGLPGMGGVYNTANLHLYHYSFNNPITYIDPNGREGEEPEETWTVSDQLNYLKEYIENTKNMTLQDKADAATALRTDLRSGRYDFDGLITGADGNEQFMNETLRGFLNTSDTGLQYSINDMNEQKGWKEVSFGAAQEHQRERHRLYPNRKFVNNTDGREAVFTTSNGKEWIVTNHIRDKGTYNYAANTREFSVNSEHGRWDMNPYFREFGITPLYRGIGNIYKKSDYNRNGRNNGTGHSGR